MENQQKGSSHHSTSDLDNQSPTRQIRNQDVLRRNKLTSAQQSSFNEKQQKQVHQQFISIRESDRKAEKLIKSLNVLKEISQNLGQDMKQSKIDWIDKKGQVSLKTENVQTKIDAKYSQAQHINNGYQKDLEQKKIKLQEVQNSTVKQTQELLTIKQLQEKLVKELQAEKDQQVKEKTQKIKDISDKIEQAKAKIKEENLGLGMRLNDIGNQAELMKGLVHTNTDYDKYKVEQERLHERIKSLQSMIEDKNKQKGEMDEKKDASRINLDDAWHKLNLIKKTNKDKFKEYLESVQEMKETQAGIQHEKKRQVELIEKANLLKDMNRFERQSRVFQCRIESVEDQQRLQEDTFKEVETCFQFIETETGKTNEELKKTMKLYQKDYKACVDNKNNICENIKNVMVKVCFRKPEELKIEQLEQNFEQLKQFEEPIQDLQQQADQLKVTLNHIRKDFFDYEQKMKVFYYNEADSLLYDNDKLIDQLGTHFKIIGDQIKKIDNEIKDKEIHMEEYLGQMESVRIQFAQAKELNKGLRGEIEEEKIKLNENRDHQDYNKDQLSVGKFQDRQDLVNNMNTVSVFTEFVSQLVDCSEQNERLKKLVNEFVKNILDKLNDLENAVKNLEEGLVGTKVEQCQNLIKLGQNTCEQIQTEIKNLENKLNMLEANADKAGNEDKRDIQQEIEKTQQLIEDIKSQREKFKRELTGLAKNQGEDLISREADIKELVRQVQNIQEKKVKEREKEVDEIEEQVIQAIRKRRGDKRKECLDEFANAQVQEKELEKVIDFIENKIEALTNEITQFQNNQTYLDQERNKDLKEKLKERLVEEQRKLKDLSQQKESVQEKIQGLALGIESITQNIVSSQALTLQAKELGKRLKDEVVEKWQEHINKAKEIKNEVKTEINRAQVIAEEVDTVKAISDELHEKYEQKNKIHQDCIQKKDKANAKLNQNDQTLLKLDKTLDQINQLLGKTIIPDTQKAKAFQAKLQDKLKHLEEMKDTILKMKEKQQQFFDRVEDACKDLDQLGDKVVLTRELVHVRDELGKVEMELNDHQENIRGFQYECDEIMQDAKYIIDENIKNKEEELVRKIKDFQEQIADNDMKYREVQNKMEEYQKIIKDGFMINDKQVQSQVKIILGESQSLEEQLKKLEKTKNNLKVQEKIIIEKLNDIRTDPKLQSIQELDNLSKLISNSLVPQGKDLSTDLNNFSINMDSRINELVQFLSKFDQLQSMNTEFDQLMRQVGRNYKNFLRKLGESADISDKLRPVLEAMSRGIEGGDYKMKEALILQEQEELQDVVECFIKLEEMKEIIEPQIVKIKNDSSGTVDAENLQNLISTVMELLDQLEQSEFNANNCTLRLNKIKDTLYSASDVPILIQQREKEITEFSTKLRKVEADYQDLKRQLIGRKSIENFQDIQQEIRNLDQAIQVFREQRVLFKRILGQELQIFLPNPQVLEDLDILTETIIKIIELGNETNKALDEIGKIQISTVKLKRQLGGLDLMKRYQELKEGEAEQRRRLQDVKKRLDRIGKGTADCDGYTSNTEEATFIETLRNELPEMSVKQNEAIDECNQIVDSLEDMQKDVEQASDLANDEDLTLKVSESLEFLEDQLGLNERTATFLEKLADKLEEHFLSMDVKKKLDKRQMELQELENICEDFDFQLAEMHSNLSADISKIEEKTTNNSNRGLVEQLQMQQQMSMQSQVIMVDEDGKQVNIIEEMVQVSDELQQVLENIIELQVRNQETQSKREEAQQEFDNKIVKNSPYKKGAKITSKTDVFYLLKANGQVKKKIIEMIKQLKEISKRMRECKKKYDSAKAKIDKQNKQKRYRAHKGDIVDELFADYINQLNCPVPIKRLGNNQYMFGTRKIFAKIINGKLVIRVGGGYMGIEEFMMYYGQQELQRITKKEQLAQQEFGDVMIEDVDSDQEILGSGRKSRINDNASQVDIDLLKKKLRQNSARKKSMSRSVFEEETKNNDGATQVVGLGDMRKVLKQNLIEIKTYQEHNSVSQMTIEKEIASRNQATHSQQVSANSFIVEKQLKDIERHANAKGAAILRNKRSPGREQRPSSKNNKDYNPSTNSSFLSNKSFYKEDEEDHSKVLTNSGQKEENNNYNIGASQSLQNKFQSRIPGIKKGGK